MHRIDANTTAAVTKKTLEMMTRKEVPLYWENYLVWFSHFLGVNKDLDADIDRITNWGGQFSEEIHRDLFTKHFGKDKRYESVNDARKEIQKLLKDVPDKILRTQNFTSDYRDKLKVFTTQLTDAGDLGEIRKVVANLMKDTVTVIQARKYPTKFPHYSTPSCGRWVNEFGKKSVSKVRAGHQCVSSAYLQLPRSCHIWGLYILFRRHVRFANLKARYP
jgi:hypothetical protein